MTEWWDQQTAALVGGLLGAGLGTIAGLYGALAGTLCSRGAARTLVIATHVTILLGGAVVLVAGVIAIILGQPYHVFFPLLLPGVVICAVMGPLLPVINTRYRQAEQRRIEAEEIRRS
jgi:hypothetical protein